MPSPTQAGRLIQFNSPLGTDVLLANSVEGVEGVSRLYSFHVELLAVQGTSIDPESLVSNKASVALDLLDSSGTRYFNGLIASFEQNPGTFTYDSYTARLVPSLWQLTLATNCRVFQGQSVMDIIKAVISPYSLSVGDVTTGSYQPLDYCTQFNETDFAFISRLAEQFGIFYWFEHSEDDNKVIFGDALSAYGACPTISTVEYVPKSEDRETFYRSVVSDFRATATMVTGKHTSANFDFRPYEVGRPDSAASASPYGKNAYERYDWPAGDSGYVKLPDKQVGTDTAKLLVAAQGDASDVNGNVFRGMSSARSLIAGYTFTLTEHGLDEWNSGYFLTEVAHRITQSPAYDSDGSTDPVPYSNTFVAITSDGIFRPEYRTPRPVMSGPQIALVVCPGGEEQYIDKYGRINVRFRWDRTAAINGTDNTWVRVAQSWASNGFGSYFWPRLNDEVLVEFIDGDPDEPVVVGSVYNGSSLPKYALPDMQTRSGIVTRSTKGGGTSNANELRFEDKMGSEQIFINAEKDLDLYVENDRRTHVLGQDSLIVDKDQLEKITGGYNRTIGGDQVESVTGKQDVAITGAVSHKYTATHGLDIGGDSNSKIAGKQGVKVTGAVSHDFGDNLSLKVAQNHGHKVGMNYALDAGMAAYIKGGMSVTIEAGVDLTLKGPGGFITIGPAGVSISGTMVLINSGGAPGSGSPPEIMPPDDPTAPGIPKDPDKADDGTKGGKM